MEMLLFLFQILFLAEIFSIDQIMKWLICSIDSLRNADLAITKYKVLKIIIRNALHTQIYKILYEFLLIVVMVLQLTC